MSNLNDDLGAEEYRNHHDRDEQGISPGDEPGLEDGLDSDRSSAPIEGAERRGTDVSRMGDDWTPDEGSDGTGRPGYQPELPGFQHASYTVSRVGPLPDPGEFAAYGTVVPDAPERILRVMERNSQVNADAVERQSKAESAALKIFATGYVALPFSALVAGVAMASFGMPGGTITAVLGGVGIVIEMGARAVGSLRNRGGDEGDDVTP